MTWFRVDDGFPEHPKLAELEHDPRLWAEALAVWMAAGCYCNRNLTDGEITHGRLRRLTPLGVRAERVAVELVRIGLWEKIADGYRFHDWHDYQPTSDEVSQKRADAADRQRRSREKRRSVGADVTAHVTRDSERDSRSDKSVSHSPPSHPTPSHPVTTDQISQRVEDVPDDSRLKAAEVLALLQNQLGWKTAPHATEVELVQQCPLTGAELKRAVKITNESAKQPGFGFLVSVIRNERKPAPQRPQQDPTQGGRVGYHPGSKNHVEGRYDFDS